MGASSIEWTDVTWNPVTGCSRVGPGCDNCYMFALYPRLRGMGVKGYETHPEDVQVMYERFNAPLSWRKPRRVFVNSMSDLFHPHVKYEDISKIFNVMREAQRRGHIFQVLTKRPGLAVGWWEFAKADFPEGWPDGVWMGTSIEDRKHAPRAEVLARLPAKVRFISAEPLIERVDLSRWLGRDGINWVIAGGESGRSARPMEIDWARDLRDQCAVSGAAFFLKQLGGRRDKRGGDKALLDGRLWREMPDAAAA